MGEHSNIEWTHHTFNPWWGCTKVSEACRNCYAETHATRFAPGHWGLTGRRKFFGEKHWREPLKWNRKAEAAGERHRVFCASMADVFEMLPDDHPDRDRMRSERFKLFQLIDMTPHLDWLLLTKRPENAVVMPWLYGDDEMPRNVWVGTTVETQKDAERRLPDLLRLNASVLFVSSEPLLGPVCFDTLGGEDCGECGEQILYDAFASCARCACTVEGPEPVAWNPLNWVIAGGESGRGARPSDPAWFRSLRDQCVKAGVPFHFKQWGEWGPSAPRPCRVAHGGLVGLGTKKQNGRTLDGRTWDEVPS